MIYFMLHDAGMKIADRTIDGVAGGIHAAIVQIAIPRHQTAHAGNRQATLPALVLFLTQGCQQRVDQYRKGHRIRFGIARIEFKSENHDAQADADLRCSETRPIEITHGVPHIGDQAVEFGGAELTHRLRYRQQARIAHFENFAYCHGS